jgi:hypothetical protein
MLGADGDKLGKSRFVTFAEAREILEQIFNQLIVSDDSNLAGLKRPVVLVGHASRQDKDSIHENLGANWYEPCVYLQLFDLHFELRVLQRYFERLPSKRTMSNTRSRNHTPWRSWFRYEDLCEEHQIQQVPIVNS